MDSGADGDLGGEVLANPFTSWRVLLATLRITSFVVEVSGVVEARDLGHVDASERQDATLRQMFQGEGDEIAGRSEDDRCVELLGWAFLRASDPYGSEVLGQGPVLFAAGEDIDFEAHVDGDLYDYVGGTAEAVEAEPAVGWNISKAEGAIADDSRAEEGGGLEVGEGVGDGEGETLIRQDMVGVAAVNVVAVEESGLAEVLAATLAEGAAAAGPVHPRDADSGPDFETFNLGAQFLHDTNGLVTWNQGRFSGRELTFDYVEVGAADATGRDPRRVPGWGQAQVQGTPTVVRAGAPLGRER